MKTEAITQMYFEFKDWKECFDTWRANKPLYGDEMQLVISTDHYTSGYWIEKKGTGITKGDIVYIGKEVERLEKRIIKEHTEAEKKERGVRFTL